MTSSTRRRRQTRARTFGHVALWKSPPMHNESVRVRRQIRLLQVNFRGLQRAAVRTATALASLSKAI